MKMGGGGLDRRGVGWIKKEGQTRFPAPAIWPSTAPASSAAASIESCLPHSILAGRRRSLAVTDSAGRSLFWATRQRSRSADRQSLTSTAVPLAMSPSSATAYCGELPC